MKFFSYYKDNSIVNFSNSILKSFGVKTFHNSLEDVDELLKNRCKIALFLFDGFGKSISEAHLTKGSFLRKNYFKTISSTFPPTTVAATNAFKSGKYPSEIGWLGWSFLDKDSNRVIEYFTHRNYKTKEACPDFDYGQFAYKTIFQIIKEERNDVNVFENYPSIISDGAKNGYKDFDDMLSKASEILQNNEKALIYNYYLDPDSSLHRSGTKHEKISRICREINKKINKFAHDNPDTLIIVFADHSHIDVKPLFIDELEELNECVTNIYAIEPRAATFKIKEGKENKFLSYYENNLKNHYDLLTKKEVIDQQLFGPTKDNYWLEKLLGDYLLIATGPFSFENFVDDPMIASHGGGTEEENLINLYVINK